MKFGDKTLVCRTEVLDYAIKYGRDKAAEWLKSIGYEGYLQSKDNYDDLMELLTTPLIHLAEKLSKSS